MMKCIECGKQTKRSYSGMCQGCYKYFRSGGKIYPLPEPGEINYGDNGNVICHICGRAYRRLGSHIRESHGTTIEAYKQQYGLCACAKTTADGYASVMRKHALENHMDEQLRITGEATRIRAGEKDKRKGKTVRLQEIKNKKKRGTNG